MTKSFESAGIKEKHPGYRFSTDNYDQLQCIVVLAGILILRQTVNGVTQPEQCLGPNSILLLRRAGTFTLECRDTYYQGLFYITSAATETEEWTGGPLTLRVTANLQTLTALMETEITATRIPKSNAFRASGPCKMDYTRDPINLSILHGLGRSLTFTALRQAYQNVASQWDNDHIAESEVWAYRVRSLLDTSIYSEQKCTQILADLPLSYRQLSRHFKSVFGTSPANYRLRARTKEARKLLSATRMSITTIAMELGFASSQHFATQFKTFTSLSPNEYRQTRGQ